jgi:hypothetical protein
MAVMVKLAHRDTGQAAVVERAQLVQMELAPLAVTAVQAQRHPFRGLL